MTEHKFDDKHKVRVNNDYLNLDETYMKLSSLEEWISRFKKKNKKCSFSVRISISSGDDESRVSIGAWREMNAREKAAEDTRQEGYRVAREKLTEQQERGQLAHLKKKYEDKQ